MPNSNCIARLLVRENESGVHVKYVNSHNHDHEFKNVKFYRWDKNTKFQINSLLEQSVPAHKIQEYLQPAHPNFNDVLPIKEHFITSTQLNKMKYELNSKKHLHQEDAIAVHLLVDIMVNDSKDSILIYKPLGKTTVIGDNGLDRLPHASELFVLGIQQKSQLTEMISGCSRILCIDSTHGTNQYKFHLLNFIVPDEYGVGYPIAHFITSHLDEETLTHLLKTLTIKCPGLHVNAVMTDGDEALSNAVKRVFGNETKHLLCSWHVKRNWQKNLHMKVKNNELLIEINEILETLIEEKNDSTFRAMLDSFLVKYADSASVFIKYFKDHYCCRKEKWAMCYRNFPHASTDTNMFVETFHNKLKTHYLNRKVNRRLDDLIQVLVTIHKTIHLGLTYKRMTEVPPIGFQKSHTSDHVKGIRISDKDVMPTSDENVWNVRSQTDPSVAYVVTKISHPISHQCLHPHLCFIKCTEFSCQDLCCHLYHCSCPNNYTLCKHVHKVHSFLVQHMPNSMSTIDSNLSSPPKKLFKSATPSDYHKEEQSKEQSINSINKLLDQLKILTQQCTPALLPYVSKSLNLLVEKCVGVINSDNCDFMPMTMKRQEIPPNAKLSPQLKLYQTMKNRRTTINRFKKPDLTRKKEIKKALLFSKEESSFTEPIGDGDPSLVVCKVGTFSITMYELKSLDYHITEEEVNKVKRVAADFQRGWLYDTVIAAFLWRITAADTSTATVDPVISQYVTTEIPLERPMAILDKIDSSRVKKIIIPLNISNSHWMLIVAWPSERKVDFYDPSAIHMEESYQYAIHRWIQVLSLKFGGKETDWKVMVPQHSTQQDSHNCGVFVSWYAERVFHGESTAECFNPYKYRKYMYDVITGLKD